MDEKLLWTVRETALAMGLSRAAVYRLVQRGILPRVRFGRAVRIPATQLRDWIARRVEGHDPLAAA